MNPPDATQPQAKREESGPKHRTGLVTLLFTDMVGSTALKQQLGDAYAKVVTNKHRLAFLV
jgi:class 3 adenylate cyclase